MFLRFPFLTLRTVVTSLSSADFEILAPAGSRESFAAALAAGADAVYLGVGALNMRSLAASTFEKEDLAALVESAHAAGVRLYLTVNTVIFDEDLPELERVLDAAKAARVDAVIASDTAVMMRARARGLIVHLSTQVNVANLDAVKFYAQFADVIVLARELTLEQTAAIAEGIRREGVVGPSGRPVRIELFVHGALCMAVSGKCYLSLHTRGQSANRGACLQNCRRTYVVKDEVRGTELEIDNGYLMSPKDLKTIELMPRLVRAGVSIFKIEGRARSPEYVLETVRCYSEALKCALAGQWSEERLADWNARLSKVFNRGFWTGHYLGETAGEWTSGYGSKATEKKTALGRVCNYFARNGIGHAELFAGEVCPGEKLLVTGPTTGAVVWTLKSLYVDERPADSACKGDSITFPVPERIRPGDQLYKLVPVER